MATLEGHNDAIRCLAMMGNDRLASAARDGSVKVSAWQTNGYAPFALSWTFFSFQDLDSIDASRKSADGGTESRSHVGLSTSLSSLTEERSRRDARTWDY